MKLAPRFLTLAAAILCLMWNGVELSASTTVVAWGAGTFKSSPPDYNNYGQSIVPPDFTNAAFVAGGWRHSLALNADGTLTAWGDDTLGQTDLPSLRNWVAIANGRLHSMALDANG